MTSTSDGDQDDASRVHDFPCPSCGAKLRFDPEQEVLSCRHCGHVAPLGTHIDAGVVTHAFDAARKRSRAHSGPATRVHCKGCGAESLIDAQATRCPFCDSPVVIDRGTDDTIVPESVLPFSVGRQAADEAFRKWVRSRWFAPNDLAKRAVRRGMDGVYLPHWAYDSKTTTRYMGQRGTHYYVTEVHTDAKGRTVSEQVRYTKWRPVTGVVKVPFKDVLVCASLSLPTSLVRRLEPWDLQGLRPYDPGYLSGFFAERHRVGLEDGFERAKERMEPRIRAGIRRDIGGDAQQIWSMQVHHDEVGFKHFLLPLWISSFRYERRVYRFIVNARTGDATGERPYSIPKIVAAAVIVLATLLLLYLLARRSDPPEPPRAHVAVATASTIPDRSCIVCAEQLACHTMVDSV